MSEIIVDVVTVEASTLTVDVIVPPPAALAVDVIAPPPLVQVVEVGNWASIPVSYAQLPPGLQQVPVSFPFDGKPTSNSEIGVPMTFPLTVPPGLAGTTTYAMTLPTNPRTFMLNQISAGTVTLLGTITFTPDIGVMLIGSGGRLATGDTLQLMTPPGQDPTLSDVGITVLLNRGS
jgi:hypothetical protein